MSLLDEFKPVILTETNNDTINVSRETISERKLANVTQDTEFSNVLNKAKVQVLQNASANNEFVKKFEEQIKEAAIKSAQLEQEKQKLEKQNIEYAQDLLATQQKLNEQKQNVDKWENKRKSRQFHYDGVKSIMKFAKIDEPMHLIVLYLLTIILSPFYLLSKFIGGTFGALLCGVEDKSRGKGVKGLLWTLLGVVAIVIVGVSVFYLLKTINII